MSSKRALETRWGKVPAEALPVRPTLLRVSDASRERVVAYVLNQVKMSSEVMPWILKRQWAYWEAHGYQADRAADDNLHRQIDATIGLDLLEWQSGAGGPKGAVEWLAGVEALGEGARTGKGNE